jgi:hypothetical protein
LLFGAIAMTLIAHWKREIEQVLYCR